MSFYSVVPAGITFAVRVQAQASVDQIVGVYNNSLKIKISAAPVEGKANESARMFLAAFFKVAKNKVILVRGKKSKNKMFFIEGLREDHFLSFLKTAL